MRNILSSLTLLTVLPAIAQSPVIGTAQFFQPGPTYIRDNYDPPPAFIDALVMASGPGYSIDLSSVNTMFLYGTEELTRVPASGPYFYYPEYYDTANVRLFVHQEQTDYGTFLFLTNEEGIHYIGGQPNGVTWPVESIFMRYPDHSFPLELEDSMTYGYVHQADIIGEWNDASGSDEHFVTGSCMTEADGYGTVIMPDGTVIQNTLRLRTVIACTDSNALFGVNEQNDTLYTWYAEGLSGPLMTLARGSHALTAGYISFLPLAVYHPQSITGVPEIATRKPRITMAPVPSSGPVHIQVQDSHHEAALSVVDQEGRTLRQWMLTGGDMHVDTGDLSTGVYRVIYQDPNVRIAKQLVIMR